MVLELVVYPAYVAIPKGPRVELTLTYGATQGLA